MFFVEAVPGEEASVQNVFISSMRNGESSIMVSKLGFRETTANGDRFIVLLDGRQYQGTPGETNFQIMNFERYALRIQSREARTEQTSTKALSSLALLRDPSNQNLSELLWRIGLPLSALTLALLAIPLSFVNPRASRSVNLVFALLTYMVYSNLISIAQAWVSQGRLPFETGWWVVHAGMGLILGLMFWRRMRVGSVLRH